MRRERLPRVFAQHVLLDRHMQRKHRAVAKHNEQEQQLRQFEPQVDEEAEVDGVDCGERKRRGKIADAEDVCVRHRARGWVVEPRLQCEHPFEPDDPQDRDRDLRDEQRRDLQHDPAVGQSSAHKQVDNPQDRRTREVLLERGKVVARHMTLPDEHLARRRLPCGERGADRDDRDARHQHEDVDDDRVGEVVPCLHEFGIRGKPVHFAPACLACSVRAYSTPMPPRGQNEGRAPGAPRKGTPWLPAMDC